MDGINYEDNKEKIDIISKQIFSEYKRDGANQRPNHKSWMSRQKHGNQKSG